MLLTAAGQLLAGNESSANRKLICGKNDHEVQIKNQTSDVAVLI